MNLSENDKNKITGKKYQPVMSITGLNDQGHKQCRLFAQRSIKRADDQALYDQQTEKYTDQNE